MWGTGEQPCRGANGLALPLLVPCTRCSLDAASSRRLVLLLGLLTYSASRHVDLFRKSYSPASEDC